MKNMSWLGFVVCGISISAQMAVAGPSGVLPLPSDVKIPEVDATSGVRALPVALIPGDEPGGKTIYVQPLEGLFDEKIEIVKTPSYSCENIRSFVDRSVKIEELANKRTGENTKDSEAHMRKREKLYDDYFRANDTKAETNAFKAKKVSNSEALKMFSDLEDKKNADIVAKKRERSTEKDPDVKNELNTQIARLENQLGIIRSQADQCLNSLSEYCDIEKVMVQIETERSEKAESAKKAYESLVAMDKVYSDVLDKDGESVLKKITAASGAFGGYLKLKMNMAPPVYIVALEKKNPGYTFKWVPSLGGVVDITFPKATDTSAVVKGTLILGQKWDSASDAWRNSANPFYPVTKEKGVPVASPTSGDNFGLGAADVKTKELLAQYSDSLTGAKQLTLTLSELGMCAILEPDASLIGAPQTRGENAKIFALSMFYSYPLHFDVKVKGTMNQAVVLHDLYKHEKKNSWLGLSRKEKIEFSRTFTDTAGIDIKVNSEYPFFSAETSVALALNIRDKLTFATAAEAGALKFNDEKIPVMTLGDINEERGASKAGGKMMLFPNPWVQVAGIVLKGLDGMFGRSQQETEKTISESRVRTIDINAGFAMPVAAGLTVGTMTAKDLVVKDQRR